MIPLFALALRISFAKDSFIICNGSRQTCARDRCPSNQSCSLIPAEDSRHRLWRGGFSQRMEVTEQGRCLQCRTFGHPSKECTHFVHMSPTQARQAAQKSQQQPRRSQDRDQAHAPRPHSPSADLGLVPSSPPVFAGHLLLSSGGTGLLKSLTNP